MSLALTACAICLVIYTFVTLTGMSEGFTFSRFNNYFLWFLYITAVLIYIVNGGV